MPSRLATSELFDDPSPGETSLSPMGVADAMRKGSCPPDQVFDHFMPSLLQEASGQHWTPTAVAKRVAEWIDHFGVRRVMDVGSGAGKFCVAAALFGRAHFIGIEQRVALVQASRNLARTFAIEHRVEFHHGTFGRIALPAADAYYLFNPFGEHNLPPRLRLDDEVEFSRARYLESIVATERLLRGARAGTYFLTYNGFGGVVPRDSYELVRTDRELPNALHMWRKTGGVPARLGGHGSAETQRSV